MSASEEHTQISDTTAANAIDILHALEWARQGGEDARLLLDENSPLRDAVRFALRPKAPPSPPLLTEDEWLDSQREVYARGFQHGYEAAIEKKEKE